MFRISFVYLSFQMCIFKLHFMLRSFTDIRKQGVLKWSYQSDFSRNVDR